MVLHPNITIVGMISSSFDGHHTSIRRSFATWVIPDLAPAYGIQLGQHRPSLDPLLQKARGPAAVRSTQLAAGDGSPNKRALRFGRIDWSTQGHKKWVHVANPAETSTNLPFFVSAEVWAPSPKLCEQDGLPTGCLCRHAQ